MRAFSIMTLLAVLILPAVASAQVQTFTATHTYILGDHDNKDDARQRCLLIAKRKILEQAGVYIESASEVKDFVLTKDKITLFAAAVMQVTHTKEEIGFQQGHMTLTLAITAQVDVAEVRKLLAAPRLDADVREDVAAQTEHLKRLEAQLEAIQKQQQVQAPGRAPASPLSDISATVQSLRTQAAQGDRQAQLNLGVLHDFGRGVPQDYARSRQWYAQAAAQGDARAQLNLGELYDLGRGVPQDYAEARQWYVKAAAQGDAGAQFNLGVLYDLGHGVPRDNVRAYMWFSLAGANGHKQAAEFRDALATKMTPSQVAEAQRLGSRCQAQQLKDC